MRINRDTLTKIARETVANRTRSNPSIVTAYLCGSLLEEEYLLGGTADIDLVFIHLDQVTQPREIVRVTEEVHLDIAHQPQKEYEQPRNLRLHPWLGPTVSACKPLYDVAHFMDFTQASVRGQFDRPDYVLERARPQAEHARQIWFDLQVAKPDIGVREIELYLRAVGHAANAVGLLSGMPLAERRFLLKFPAKAAAVRRPGLYPGLMGLLGGPNVDEPVLRSWLPAWELAFSTLPRPVSLPRLHPDRKSYYLLAFHAMLRMDEPRAMLWPLLNTWTDAVGLLPAESNHQIAWREACQRLELLGEAFTERVTALDAYLDMVEDTLDGWAKEAGA
jgi:hypothetical protein